MAPFRNLLRWGHRLFAVGFSVLFLIPILWAIEPFWRIRLAVIAENRIGHVAVDLDLFVRRRQLYGRRPRTSYVFIVWHPANRQLLEMWKRHLTIVESRLFRRLVMDAKPVLLRTRFIERIRSDWHEHEVMSRGTRTLSFTASERERGEALLAEMGIGPNDWFVAFHARDPAYVTQREGFGDSQKNPRHRDCSVENYMKAANWIAEQGGYAIRMGAIVDRTLPEMNHRIIDYATKHRSEFMDVFLSATCKFFLGSTSGLYGLPLVFNVPFGLANFAPYNYVGLSNRCLFTPKLLREIETGRILTFAEIRVARHMRWSREDYLRFATTDYFAEIGLEFIENDPEEILGLAMDMMDRVEGREPAAELRELQEAYHALYAGTPHDTEYAGRIGPRFIGRHRHLLEGA